LQFWAGGFVVGFVAGFVVGGFVVGFAPAVVAAAVVGATVVGAGAVVAAAVVCGFPGAGATDSLTGAPSAPLRAAFSVFDGWSLLPAAATAMPQKTKTPRTAAARTRYQPCLRGPPALLGIGVSHTPPGCG
jgi:hypothetical protein